MLNKAERYEVAKFFGICSTVGQLPAEVDLTQWQLNAPSTRKIWIWALSFILYALHVMYKIGSWAFVLLYVADVPLHQLIIHTVYVVTIPMCVFWYCLLYIWNPSLFATYFRMTLLGNVGDSLGPEDQLTKKWTKRCGEYSMQDAIARSLPYIAILTAPFLLAPCVYDPSMRLLLYSALPKDLQNWLTFGLCLLEEIRLIAISNAIVLPVWQLQVIAFENTARQLQDLMRKIQNGSGTSNGVYRILRSLQLYISIVNNVNAYLIFTWKLLSITLCTLSGYAAVAYFRVYPVFGIMYCVLLVNTGFIYAVMYQKAFKIPQLFDQAAGCALRRSGGNQRNAFKRRILSIRRTGVKVGHFHTMERVSTLIFVNFVINNIVSMLVAYG